MRVLFVNSVCGIGSTGKICTDLASALEEQGHEAKIAYGRDPYVPEQFQKYGVRIGTDSDVKFHGLESRLLDNHGEGSKRATRKFIDWVQGYKPDIIHLHNIHGYYLNIEILFNYLKRVDIPVVWTLHDAWPFTGHCVYFDYVGCNKWKTGCGRCPQKGKYPSSLFLDRSARNLRNKQAIFSGVKNMTLVTPSEWLAGLTRETYLSMYSVEVINNGIDTERFKPAPQSAIQELGLSEKKVVLGVSLGWGPHKRLDYLVRMAGDLGEEYQVVLIGLNKSQIESLPKNVIGFEKTRDVEELVAWYSKASVYVNPTMEDNYPTVNLEAQACGTPVVTFLSGGSAECIKDGYGIAVERGNYEALVQAVHDVAEMKGRKSVPHIMGKREFAEEYLRLYGNCSTQRYPCEQPRRS